MTANLSIWISEERFGNRSFSHIFSSVMQGMRLRSQIICIDYFSDRIKLQRIKASGFAKNDLKMIIVLISFQVPFQDCCRDCKSWDRLPLERPQNCKQLQNQDLASVICQ
jgi:hypothetical protein